MAKILFVIGGFVVFALIISVIAGAIEERRRAVKRLAESSSTPERSKWIKDQRDRKLIKVFRILTYLFMGLGVVVGIVFLLISITDTDPIGALQVFLGVLLSLCVLFFFCLLLLILAIIAEGIVDIRGEIGGIAGYGTAVKENECQPSDSDFEETESE